MPLRGYSTDNKPPTVLDHLFAHPLSITLGAWQGMLGVLALLMTLFDFTVSPSLSRLPEPLIAATGVLFAVGGFQVIRGLLDDSEDLMKGWKIERTGLIFTMAAWFAFGVTVAATYPTSVATWSLCFIVGVGGHGLRFEATRREERRTRERMHRTGVQ